jgi:hypothetical protein
VAIEAGTCGCSVDCAMEETGVRKVVLFEMHSDKGDKFWDGLYMSCSKNKVGKGDGGGVCALWMSRMRQ